MAKRSDCGFAIEVHGEDLIEANAEDTFGPRGDADDRDKAKRAGYISGKGKITNKGWKKLNDDILKLERNALAWLRKKFLQARDEGHDNRDDLVGTVWYDPKDADHSEIIEMGGHERIDMVDTSYGDLADDVWKGVSPFGQAVLGGQITFFDVEEDEEE